MRAVQHMIMEEEQQLGAAAAAVFYTAELLESILKLLPMKDLLLDQRVCTHWRDVIKQSPELQQNLFFQPREATTHWLYTGNETEHMITQVTKDYASGQDEWVLPSGELNPLMFSAPKKDYYGTVLAAAQGGSESFEFRHPRAFRHLCAHPEGSWRRMLISQPPTRNWSYELEFGCGRMETEDVTAFEDITAYAVMEQLVKLTIDNNHGLRRRCFWGLQSHCFWTEGVLFATREELNTDAILEQGWQEEDPSRAARWIWLPKKRKWIPQERPERCLRVRPIKKYKRLQEKQYGSLEKDLSRFAEAVNAMKQHKAGSQCHEDEQSGGSRGYL